MNVYEFARIKDKEKIFSKLEEPSDDIDVLIIHCEDNMYIGTDRQLIYGIEYETRYSMFKKPLFFEFSQEMLNKMVFYDQYVTYNNKYLILVDDVTNKPILMANIEQLLNHSLNINDICHAITQYLYTNCIGKYGQLSNKVGNKQREYQKIIIDSINLPTNCKYIQIYDILYILYERIAIHASYRFTNTYLVRCDIPNVSFYIAFTNERRKNAHPHISGRNSFCFDEYGEQLAVALGNKQYSGVMYLLYMFLTNRYLNSQYNSSGEFKSELVKQFKDNNGLIDCKGCNKKHRDTVYTSKIFLDKLDEIESTIPGILCHDLEGCNTSDKDIIEDGSYTCLICGDCYGLHTYDYGDTCDHNICNCLSHDDDLHPYARCITLENHNSITFSERRQPEEEEEDEEGEDYNG